MQSGTWCRGGTNGEHWVVLYCTYLHAFSVYGSWNILLSAIPSWMPLFMKAPWISSMGFDRYHLHCQKSPTSSWVWFHSATQLIDIPFHSVKLGLSSLPNVRYQRICQTMKEDHIPKADTVYVAIRSQLTPTSKTIRVLLSQLTKSVTLRCRSNSSRA